MTRSVEGRKASRRDRRIGALLSPLPDAPGSVEWRVKHAAVSAQVLTERKAKFPTLTDENADEMLAWQEARIAELMR